MSVLFNKTHLNRGVDLFNRAHFFDAHEVLEDVWRSIPRDGPRDGPRVRPSRGHLRLHLRLHLQGMVQLAVAFHHASAGNLVGARSVLERAMRNLNGADSSFPDLDLERLRAELALWRRYLDDCNNALDARDDAGDVRRRTAPALPKILLRS